MASSTDRIEKKVHLKAPRARVWKALTDAEEFGRWFGVKLEGPFVPGERARGRITHPGYEHVTMEIVVDRMEPEHTFAWRWHPAAIEPDVDYASEPMTVVAFTLEEQDGGTLLTVVESGFDGVPLTRRQTALRMNTEGWEGQMRNIERHVG
jgi:uncharacterized protein YndB with AHSA1/START domain